MPFLQKTSLHDEHWTFKQERGLCFINVQCFLTYMYNWAVEYSLYKVAEPYIGTY